MTDPSLCTAQINQTIVSDSKIQVFQTYHTNILLRLVLYINVIFLIAETDMIAARIIFYKMQADSSMNRGTVCPRSSDPIYIVS